MTISGGELLLDLFQACGIEYIFCSPGTEWTPVWEGLLKRRERGDSSLHYINCRDEVLAVSMAQGYAEVSGGLPAVLLHAGVGPLHGAMAMRNALSARVPMLIFGGETCEHCGDDEVRAQGFHWLGLLSDIGGPSAQVRSYVKWSNEVKSRDGLADSVYRGCQLARSAPAGPVFISVPSELLLKSGTGSTRPCPAAVKVEPCLADLQAVARQLVHARQPVIIAENAGRDPAAVSSLVALAETLGIPVFESSLPYTSSFPRNNPFYMGVNVAETLREADVVFVVDSVTPWYPPAAGPPESAKVIVLDEAPLHERLPFWGYHVDTAITAAAAPALEALVDLVRRETAGAEMPGYRQRRQYWQGKHDEMAAQLEREALAGREKKPMAARWFLRAAGKSLPSDSILVDETIMHTRVVHAYLAEPGRYIKAAYGGLGVGMGEALGVKLARPDRPVVLMIGDGSFNYNPALAALGLGQEYGLPVFIIIFDNGGYQAMKWGHQRLYPQGIAMTRDVYLGVDITPAPDYVKIAGAFGAYGERLEEPANIEAAIKRCLERIAGGNTALLDVMLESAPPFTPPPPRE
jgi:acetolactate synthase I/II/III large subunit